MNENYCRAPLFEHLVDFSFTKPLSLHVPGHRNGNVYKQLINSFSGAQRHYIEALANLARLDVTELSHTDDLHDPQGVIMQAQQLTAKLYGASHSLFLVGGSTAGNVALVLSLCEAGDTIIVQRNVHKSIINGCRLAEAKAVFLTPELEKETKLATIPSLSVVERAIKQYPHAKAVFLTNPNYYGLTVDLKPYIELAHTHSLPLIVDEAHGAHFGIAPYSPNSALTAGADAVVQSAHKTLPALTMGAYLHIKGERIKVEEVQRQLAVIESSSPSYLLMASLDIARALLQEHGKAMFQQSYQLRQSFIDWLEENSRLSVRQISPEAGVYQDPYRVLLYDRKLELSGIELQKMLEQEGIWVEMANSSYAVLVWHMAMNKEQLEQLQHAIQQVELKLNSNQTSILNKENYVQHVPQAMNDKLAVSTPIAFKRKIGLAAKLVSFEQAEGKLCAEQVIPYPPGIPLLYEGEQITGEHIKEINGLLSLHIRFQGAEALNEGRIKVFSP